MLFGILELPYTWWSMSLLLSCSPFHGSLTCPSVCKDRCRVDSECRILWKFRSCRSSKFFNIPVVEQRQIPIIQTALRTFEFPQLLLDKVVDAPIVQVVQVVESLWWRRGCFMVLQIIEIPQFWWTWWSTSLLCRSFRWFTSSWWCRGRFPWSRRPWEFPSCSWPRWSISLYCWWCEFHRCRRGEDTRAPTVALAEKLAAFPDL